MSIYKIENEEAVVFVDEHASEIHSFKDKKSGLEYMWQGDPAYWSGRNPTLFPMVGSTWDHVLHIDGKEYPIGNHGFCRHSDFACVKHTDDEIVMELKDSEETRKQYPFAFTLDIDYRLESKSLKIAYAIRNDTEKTMPFNFGLHPAFNCPVDPAKDFMDYHIEFDQPETFSWSGVTLDHETTMKLDREALAKTVIIQEPKSSYASLTDGEHGVKVKCAGFRWLAFWSKQAPFVCIEPWFSHTDFEKVEVPFEKREGTLFLPAGLTWHADYSITIF